MLDSKITHSAFNFHYQLPDPHLVPKLIHIDSSTSNSKPIENSIIRAEAKDKVGHVVFKDVRGATPLGSAILTEPDNPTLLKLVKMAAAHLSWQNTPLANDQTPIRIEEVHPLFEKNKPCHQINTWLRSHAWDVRIGLGNVYFETKSLSFDVLSWGIRSEFAVVERMVAELTLFFHLLQDYKNQSNPMLLDTARYLVSKDLSYPMIESTWSQHLIRNFYLSPKFLKQQLSTIQKAKQTIEAMIGDLK